MLPGRPQRTSQLQFGIDATCVLTGAAIVMLFTDHPSIALGLGLVALFLAATVLAILVRSER